MEGVEGSAWIVEVPGDMIPGPEGCSCLAKRGHSEGVAGESSSKVLHPIRASCLVQYRLGLKL